MDSKARLCSRYVSEQLNSLRNEGNTGAGRAKLAVLRRGAGKIPGELPELCGFFLKDLPETLQGATEKPSHAEWAIYTALTLYALHQQGHDVERDNMHMQGANLGQSVHKLVPAGDDAAEKRILQRFNQMATSSDMKELSNHLRGMVQLLRANGVPLDYMRLARDLYNYQFTESRSDVRLAWGRDYYSWKQPNATEKTDEHQG